MRKSFLAIAIIAIAIVAMATACTVTVPAGSTINGSQIPTGVYTLAQDPGTGAIKITGGSVITTVATITPTITVTPTATISSTATITPTTTVTTPVLNTQGHPGPTTGEAKVALGLDVQRLDTEPAAFVVRSPLGAVSAICPQGWTCTLTLQSGNIKVYVGDGAKYQLTAGTFRFVNGYPSGDAVKVNPPCALTSKEDFFGQMEAPSFHVTPGNFTCP